MKIVEKAKQNKKDIIIFIIIFLMTLCIFYNFITMHYCTDTYNIINLGYKEYAIKYSLNDGRPVMCAISLLADCLNVPIQVYVIGLTIIALFVSCISIMKLKNIIINCTNKRTKVNELMIILLSYITIFNFAYLENMQFAECAVMALSVLINIIVAKILTEKKNNYMIKSLLLTILSVLLYQGTLNWLITITFVLSVLKESKFNMQVIKNVFMVGTFILIGVIINLVQIKITGLIFGLTQTRMGGISNIMRNSQDIILNLSNMLFYTYYIFPKGIMVLHLVIMLILAWACRKPQEDVLTMLIIIACAIGAACAPWLIALARI